jgi:hypothetical protein
MSDEVGRTFGRLAPATTNKYLLATKMIFQMIEIERIKSYVNNFHVYLSYFIFTSNSIRCIITLLFASYFFLLHTFRPSSS